MVQSCLENLAIVKVFAWEIHASDDKYVLKMFKIVLKINPINRGLTQKLEKWGKIWHLKKIEFGALNLSFIVGIYFNFQLNQTLILTFIIMLQTNMISVLHTFLLIGSNLAKKQKSQDILLYICCHGLFILTKARHLLNKSLQLISYLDLYCKTTSQDISFNTYFPRRQQGKGPYWQGLQKEYERYSSTISLLYFKQWYWMF